MGRLSVLMLSFLTVSAVAAARAEIHVIQVEDFQFSPTGTIVYPGDTVRWQLITGTHTSTSDPSSPKQWASNPLRSFGEIFDLVFDPRSGPGPFPYHCEFYPAMRDTIFAAAECSATGDVNGDGLSLTAADQMNLAAFVNGEEAPPILCYEADLNGDCAIDEGDVEMFALYFEQGMEVFEQYPVPTCCFPDTIRGACCAWDTCTIRAEKNCPSAPWEPPQYRGDGRFCMPDYACDCCEKIRGNANGDPVDKANISDASFLLTYLFGIPSGPAPYCLLEADCNADGRLNVSDVCLIICFLFSIWPSDCECEPCP